MPNIFKLKKPKFPMREKFKDGYPRKELYSEPIFDGPKIVMPPHNPDGPYPGLYFFDRQGNFLANVDAHELTNDGKDWHMHLTIKTARENSNLDRSRVHVTVGHEVAQMQITEYCELVTYKPPIFRGEDNQFYRLIIGKGGEIRAEKVDKDYIQFTRPTSGKK